MTLIHLSDSHKREDEVKIEKCNILIHSGDANLSSLKDLNCFISWLNKQDTKYKIFVPGNHDDICENAPSLVKELFSEAGIIYLENSLVEIEGIKIWGSPYTPRYGNWSFMLERGDDIARIWKMIPEDIDILITHGPPINILDLTRKDIHCGCWDLGIVVKRIQPKLHLFGHVHEGYGYYTDGFTKYYNSSILNAMYEFKNEPHIIEYQN